MECARLRERLRTRLPIVSLVYLWLVGIVFIESALQCIDLDIPPFDKFLLSFQEPVLFEHSSLIRINVVLSMISLRLKSAQILLLVVCFKLFQLNFSVLNSVPFLHAACEILRCLLALTFICEFGTWGFA